MAGLTRHPQVLQGDWLRRDKQVAGQARNDGNSDITKFTKKLGQSLLTIIYREDFMRFITYKRLVTVLSAVLTAAFFAHGVTPPELAGHWVFASGSAKGPEKSVELHPNGTGTVDGRSVTWNVENNRLALLAAGAGIAAAYKVSGHELVLTYYDGKSATFTKKGKAEESAKRFEKTSSHFTDSRNGRKYRAVKIDGATWMAQNLNYQTGKSWCYGNDDANCEKYGRLYDWNTAKSVCPPGWQLPSRQKWGDLERASGGSVSGAALKSVSGWDDAGNGSDDFGFSALPGGRRGSGGGFRNIGKDGYWWTSTSYGSGFAYRRHIFDNKDNMAEDLTDKGDGYYVRCLQDN